MLFLAVFGKNVEDAFGHVRYLAFYFAGGFVAMMTQTLMTLLFGTGGRGARAEPRCERRDRCGARRLLRALPELEGARSRRHLPGEGLGLVLPRLLVPLPAVEANFGLFSATANGGGVAFFAHVGGFIFGALVAIALINAGRVQAQDYDGVVGAPA